MNTTPTVAFLGPAGTFTQAAAISHFGKECQLIACASIDEVFLRVEEEAVQFGVVPVENSTEGIVNNTQDCLIDSKVKIIGEQVIDIHHHLLVEQANPDMKIACIASHRQSLAQCRRWIQKSYPKAALKECVSNAEAAVSVSAAAATAAIAGELAADTYNLAIKERDIQDQDHNSTRFLILAQDSGPVSGRDKTSVLVYAANKPGALFRVLEPFENLQISLTKIDSRPSKRKAWEYVFFIDFEGHEQDERTQELFRRLRGRAEGIKVLGSYPLSDS